MCDPGCGDVRGVNDVTQVVETGVGGAVRIPLLVPAALTDDLDSTGERLGRREPSPKTTNVLTISPELHSRRS